MDIPSNSVLKKLFNLCILKLESTQANSLDSNLTCNAGSSSLEVSREIVSYGGSSATNDTKIIIEELIKSVH